MPLVLQLDLVMVKMYHHAKNEVFMSRHSKVIAQMDRHIHKHTDIHSMKTLSSAYGGGNNKIIVWWIDYFILNHYSPVQCGELSHSSVVYNGD